MVAGRAPRWKERHILAVLGSSDELIDKVGCRPDMFVGRARYANVRSFVEGFGAGKDDVLHGFQRWLSSQPVTDPIRTDIARRVDGLIWDREEGGMLEAPARK